MTTHTLPWRNSRTQQISVPENNRDIFTTNDNFHFRYE